MIPDEGLIKTYPAPSSVHTVTLVSDEVTCIGTSKGNPDFYVVEVVYGPDKRILCTKSLKHWFGERWIEVCEHVVGEVGEVE